MALSFSLTRASYSELNLGTILNFWLPASGTGTNTNTVYEDSRK